jgi:hypothetical protein
MGSVDCLQAAGTHRGFIFEVENFFYGASQGSKDAKVPNRSLTPVPLRRPRNRTPSMCESPILRQWNRAGMIPVRPYKMAEDALEQ